MSKSTKGKVERNVISILGKTNLKPGDQVVVVEPLNVPVLSSRTGKFLGMDERVLGRGTVEKSKSDDNLQVKLKEDRVWKEQSKMSLFTAKSDGLHSASARKIIARLKKQPEEQRCLVNDVNLYKKPLSVKLEKSHGTKVGQEVIIKLVNPRMK